MVRAMGTNRKFGTTLGLWAVMGTGALVGITACGGSGSSNGEAAKSPTQILTDAQAATSAASSVHITGQATSSGKQVTLDVADGQGKGGGTVGISGSDLQLVLAQPNLYLKADQAAWQALSSNSGAAAVLANKWIQTTTSSSDFSDLGNLLDISKLPGQFSPKGTPTKGKTTTFNGQSAITLIDSSGGGTLYVADKGKPYILGVTGGQDSPGTLTFGQYNSATIPAAPAGAVSLSQLENG
jgi:hypothetical protein